MILLVGAEKGGVGKTLLATALAAMRAARGNDVLLVDADPQGSASSWAAARSNTGANGLTCVSKTGAGLRKDVQDLAERFGDVVIDAGGRDSKELRAAMVVADRMHIPVQPSVADLETLDAMEEIVGQARAFSDLDVSVVLSRAYTDPRIPETGDAIEWIKDYDALPWSGVVIRERVAFRRAFARGLSPEELEADSKAAEEMNALYQHAFRGAE